MRHAKQATMILWVTLALACSNSEAGDNTASSGGTPDGGTAGADGAPPTGGKAGIAGATQNEGTAGTDDVTGAAGNADAGGAAASGGRSSTGGRTGTGGSGGGSSAGGGSLTGGATGTGGRAGTGGRTGVAGSGGRSSAGGSSATGGTASTGGRSGTGGRSATGGTAGTGGQAGTGGGSATGGDGGSPSSDYWVVGSHPDYQWSGLPAAEVPWTHLTHLFVGFLEPAGSAGNYSLDVTGYGPATLAAWKTAVSPYIQAAHAADVKVVADLGGAGLGGDVFSSASSNATNAAALASAIVSGAQDLGLDGVDLDWEESFDAEGAVTLLKALRSAWPDGIITVAVGPSFGSEQTQIANTLHEAEDQVDAVMIMSYIAPVGSWGGWIVPVPNTPLYDAAPDQSYSADRDRTVWTGAGFPASKLVMGVGGFGLVWADTNNDDIAPVAPYANASNPNGAADTETDPLGCTDNIITQRWVDATVAASNGALTLHDDDIGKVQYWAAPAKDQLVSVSVPSDCGRTTANVGLILYETPTSMANKAAYVQTHAMRGMEFWTLAQCQNAEGAFPIIEAAK
jgi:GH18 family chitinase